MLHPLKRIRAFAWRVYRYVVSRLWGAFAFRACHCIGKNARAHGLPFIQNLGRIDIGDQFQLSSRFTQSHLVTLPTGHLRIGNCVSINFGAAISSAESVSIGDHVRMGPYAMIMDSDFHASHNRDEKPSAPIIIEDHVWLAARVTVLKGSHIGAGSVITAGSVVTGTIPPGVVAGGVPARVLKRIHAIHEQQYDVASAVSLDEALIERLQKLIQKQLPISKPILLSDGAHSLPHWDSFAHLNMMRALEQEFHITLSPDDVLRCTTLERMAQVIQKHTESTQHLDAYAGVDMHRVEAALYQSAQKYPHKIVCIEGEHTYTYLDLLHAAERIAAELEAQQAGASVMIRSSSKFQFIALLYGVFISQRTAIPVVHTISEEDVRVLQKRCGVMHLFHDQKLEVLPDCEADFVHADTSIATIMFTSGTTSTKKAVLLTHANLKAATRNIINVMNMNDSMIEFISMPLHHSFGLGRVRALIEVGATFVVQEHMFHAASAWNRIEQYHCNAISAVPAGMRMLLQERHTQKHADAIQWVKFGSAVMSSAFKEEIATHFKHANVIMHYGLTEASRSTFLNFEHKTKRDSVGHAVGDTKITIMLENGVQAALGEVGEIVIQGAHVAYGYLNPTIEQAHAFQEGQFYTGDLGYLDADGYLYFVGRKDDMLNVGGVKVSPVSVEDKIKSYLPNLEYAIVGLTDALLGTVPCLVIQYSENMKEHSLYLNAIKHVLASAEMPQRVCVVEKLPKTENGKLQRRILTSMIEKQCFQKEVA